MGNSSPDNMSLDEVIDLCQNINDTNIEVASDPCQRPKNFEFMCKFEYTDDDVRDIIHSLTKNDYYRGPTPDHIRELEHPFWEFIKSIDRINVSVYIKIKIINHHRKIIVFSVHEEGVFEI